MKSDCDQFFGIRALGDAAQKIWALYQQLQTRSLAHHPILRRRKSQSRVKIIFIKAIDLDKGSISLGTF
jgi:hypothetical protein